MSREKRNVKVVNRGENDFEQEFNGTVYKIKKGGHLIMNRRVAISLLGTMSGIDKNNPQSHGLEKNLELVPIESPPRNVGQPGHKEFMSHMDGKCFKSQAELDEHVKTISTGNTKAESLKEEEEDQGTVCPICKQTGLKGKEGLKVHLMICKGK